MLWTLFLTAWTFLAVSISILAYRNMKIFDIRFLAIEVIHSYLRSRIHNHDWTTPWVEPELNFERLRKPSYGAMLFDLTKWSFKSFYPDLVQYVGPAKME